MTRLRIDNDRCSGNGRCYTVFPEFFSDDECGYGQALDVGIGEDQLADAQRAMLCCPEQAITLDDG